MKARPIGIRNVRRSVGAVYDRALCAWCIFCWCICLLVPAQGASQDLWHVFVADTLHRGQTSFSASYDRIARNPGNLTISTTNIEGDVGITPRLEFETILEANKRVVVRRAEQLSFGQQALGFFGDRTPGSPPTPAERVAGSSRMPQLRFPPSPQGALTGAAGYYNLLPFAGFVHEGDGIGQVTVAVKVNLLSESKGARLGLSVRPHIDVPIKKGIEYLFQHPTSTADLQFGFDGIVSKNIGDAAALHWNVGYRHVNQPAHVSIVQLADEAPLGFAWVVPRETRIQLVGETTAEVFFGSHTPNTTFGAADPIDLTLGFRILAVDKITLSGGYRRTVNQHGGDKNGFIVKVLFGSRT